MTDMALALRARALGMTPEQYLKFMADMQTSPMAPPTPAVPAAPAAPAKTYGGWSMNGPEMDFGPNPGQTPLSRIITGQEPQASTGAFAPKMSGSPVATRLTLPGQGKQGVISPQPPVGPPVPETTPYTTYVPPDAPPSSSVLQPSLATPPQKQPPGMGFAPGSLTSLSNKAMPFGSATPEPWQTKARDDDEYARQYGLAIGMKNIAEGLGSIRIKTPGDIRLRTQDDRPPIIAEEARAREAQLQNSIGPAEAEFLRSQGFPAQVGMSRNLLGGNLFSLMREKGIQGRHEAGLERRDKALDIAQGNLGMREKSFERVPDTDRRSLGVKRFIVKKLEDIGAQYDQISGELGPIWGRWNQVARKLGFANPEAIRTIADLSFQMSQFIYEMTGKQMNNEEMGRLESVLPQAWDSPEQFRSILGGFIQTIKDKYEFDVDALRRQGRDTSEWQDITAPVATPNGPRQGGLETNQQAQGARPPADTGRKQSFVVNGEIYTIPEELVGEFLKDNPGAVRQ